jgi:hypothetical protein
MGFVESVRDPIEALTAAVTMWLRVSASVTVNSASCSDKSPLKVATSKRVRALNCANVVLGTLSRARLDRKLESCGQRQQKQQQQQ